jgi:FKBP-type peptidyl-prolyl cis-trans isomerase (trigger factor)
MIVAIEANAPVATVNGQDIKAADLESGIEQLSQAAVQQGFDPTDLEVQSEIRSQAVEMMVNTALLEQVAVENDINVETEAIDARINELAEAAGGKEALLERLAEFEIDEDQLRSDVKEELTIRALLDTVFTEADAVVTEEEIAGVYQNAVASNGGQPLPPLAEVSAQIEQQLLQTKEQEAIEAYVQSLRAAADITIN